MVLTQLPRRVVIAPPVTTTTTRVKGRAFNAAPVNSMVLPVRFVVHCVQIRRTLVEKEETTVASIVQWVGRPKMAVRNVSLAVRARLAKAVKIAH